MKFECHLTFDKKDRDLVKAIAEGDPQWVFSEIDGDPIMGQQRYCYLTTYQSAYEKLYERMKDLVGWLYETQHRSVALRQKIELIMYDTKTGVGL